MIKKSVNIKCFKYMLMKLFSLQERSLFSVHDWTGNSLDLELVKERFRLKFSHLNEHKFCHDFKDTIVVICICGTETETTEHFFLRCSFFVTEREKLYNDVYDKLFSSQNLSEKSMIVILFYECNKFHERGNKEILLHKICYIKPI